MAQTFDPAALARKVVPILLEKCDPPHRLAIIHYRDLTSNDPEQWDLLMRDLL
jgi:hypothetical protein